MRQYYVWISFLHEHRYMIWQHEIMHLVALFCLFRPIFWYVTCLQMSMCFNTHELVYGLLFYIPCFIMIFGIRHWYILAYLCMYLYWLGIFIIYVHFNKCKCTIWLGSKLIELDTSNRSSSSFWYCQRGRDLDAQAKDE